MKFLLALSILVSTAFANTVVSERTVILPVDLTKVKLSNSGYSSHIVKVLIPELADVTIANHRNEDEDAPCLATYEAMKVEEVVQNKPETIEVPLKITLKKHTWVDEENKVCKVGLQELVEGNIRGFNFVHDRWMDMPDRHLEDCR